jgi:hypothetical protein
MSCLQLFAGSTKVGLAGEPGTSAVPHPFYPSPTPASDATEVLWCKAQLHVQTPGMRLEPPSQDCHILTSDAGRTLGGYW